MKLTNIIKNVTPSVAVMVAGLLGAWLVYDNYFSDKVSAEQISTFEPAAGEDMAAPAVGEEMPMDSAPVVEGTVGEGAPAVPAEVKCMMDEHGAPIMNAEGTACVPMPMEEVVPAVEGAVEGVVEGVVDAVEGAVEAVPTAPAAPEMPAAPAH